MQYVYLFDLDDTLIEIINSYSYFDNIIIEVFKKYNKKVPTGEQRDLLWRNTDYKTLLSSWNFPDHVLFWKTFDNFDYIGRHKLLKNGKIRIFKDVRPFFQKIDPLNNIISIIITNTTQEIAEFVLKYFNITKFFSHVYGLGEIQELCKPAPGGINLILRDLSYIYNFQKSNVYIIGDSENDILAGKSAGIKTVYLNRKNKEIDSIPDYSIKILNELIQIINKDENGDC